MNDAALRDVASRQHLSSYGYTPATVPAWYLESLKKHATVYKDDLNFKVTLQPGTGLGSIFCMESGCQKVIPLDARRDAVDGGLEQGFGSFLKYQVHARQDPAHGDSRVKRVKRERMARLTPKSQTSATALAKPRTSSGSILSALETSPGAGSSNSHSTELVSSQRHQALTPSTNPLLRGREASKPNANLAKASTSTSASGANKYTATSRASMLGLSSDDLFGTPKKKAIAPPPVPQQPTVTTVAAPSPAVRERERKPYTGGAPSQPSSSLPQGVPLHMHRPGQKRPSSSLAGGAAKKPKTTPVPATPAHATPSVLNASQNSPRRPVKAEPAVKAEPTVKAEPVVKAEPLSDANISLLERLSRTGLGGYSDPPPMHLPANTPVPPKAVKPEPSPRPRTSLPGMAAALNYDPIQAAINGLSQAYGSTSTSYPNFFDNDDDLPAPWLHRSTGPKMNLNDVLMDLAGSTFDENATIDGALTKLGLPNAHTRLPGMSSILLPHQILGVAWMVERERLKDRGGILADEMGLGNVQTIAMMTQNRSKDDSCKTTLILCPTALLCQWKAEIEMHTDGEPFRVLIYHGAARKKHTTAASLAKYDVILTTFTTVALEKPTPQELRVKQRAKKKKNDKFIETDSEYDSEDEKPAKKKKEGPLISFHWYRIVLDEAQNIRNKRTRTSQVIAELWADHRWCLTGTPIVNTLEDAYPYFAFLAIRPWNDWTDFREHILQDLQRNPGMCTARLQAIWRTVMLRRKKDSKLDGEPLVRLPPKTVTDIELAFSPEERQTYDAICARAQAVFNRYLRAGTVLKNYQHVFVMLLRLRQICVHPCLIAEYVDAFRTEDELEGVKEREALNEVLGRARRECGQLFVDRMLAKRKAVVDARIAAEKESPDASTEQEECPVCSEPLVSETSYATECCHAFCEECLDRIMQTPHVVDINEKDKYKGHQRPCPVCRGPISKERAYLEAAFDPVEPTFVQDSDDEDVKPSVRAKRGRPSKGKGKAKIEEDEDVKPSITPKKEENEMDWEADEPPKPVGAGRRAALPRGVKAKGVAKAKKRVSLPEFDDDENSDDSIDDFIVYSDEDEDDKDKAKAARTRRAKAQREEDEAFGAEAEESDAEADGDRKPFVNVREIDPAILNQPMAKPLERFLPSAKMLKMMELLKQWRDEFPKDKCMIISQWTSVLELCSSYLDENDFKHLSFTGKMTLRQRDDAVNMFKNDKDTSVLLMSMKAGGVGLNLTAANRVILLDLGWSPAIEGQAFDRVHRLGQQKDVEIYRLVIVETVEARVLDLQKRKQNLMDGSLGEGTARRQQRLSVRELAALFGINMGAPGQ